jgi:hypothetical protein
MYDSKASGSRRAARLWAKNFCHVWREDIVGSERSRGRVLHSGPTQEEGLRSQELCGESSWR